MVNYSKFYGGTDAREVGLYGVAEAARIVDRVPPSTLRGWCNTVLTPASLHPMTLSFNNLIESRVLRALRVKHKVQMDAIRDAIKRAERELNVERLLLHKELRTDGSSLIIDYYGEFTHLNPGKQLAMKKVLDSVLSRVEWGEDDFARRFYPTFAGEENSVVFIDPLCSFGRALVSDRYISTGVIHGRISGGEALSAVAKDYQITTLEVEQAVVFEEAA